MVEFPLVSAELGTGPSPELVASLAWQRARGGLVARLGPRDYLDGGHPASDALAGGLEELLAAGWVALAGPDPLGLRWVRVTDAGQRRHDTPRAAGVRVPDPQFSTPRTRLAAGRAAPPAPGGQPAPHRRAGGEPGASPPRWAHCPDDGCLHLVAAADAAATTGGHAEALCGQALGPHGLTLSRGCAGSLCLTCLAGIDLPFTAFGGNKCREE